MAGYRGYSMSNNAVTAYENGEKPISKWTKTAILGALRADGLSEHDLAVLSKYPVGALKERVLVRSSWHHTSSRYNRTDFYSVSMDRAEELASRPYVRPAKTVREPVRERWLAEWAEWGGTRKHPKIIGWVVEEGYLENGWFYYKGGKKKASGNYFRLKERL